MSLSCLARVKFILRMCRLMLVISRYYDFLLRNCTAEDNPKAKIGSKYLVFNKNISPLFGLSFSDLYHFQKKKNSPIFNAGGVLRSPGRCTYFHHNNDGTQNNISIDFLLPPVCHHTRSQTSINLL